MARKSATIDDLSHIAEPLRGLAVAVADLIPDPANARTHPEANISALVGSLQVYGQRKPIVVNSRNNVVEAGNGTLAAAIKLGWTHIAAVFVDDDPSVAAGFAISDNRTAELAEWDNVALDALLREIDTGSEALQQMLVDLADEAGLYREEVASPEDFKEVDEDIDTEHECPKCGYKWSGGK